MDYYKTVLNLIAAGQSLEDVAANLQALDNFKYLKESSDEVVTVSSEFSPAVKTVTYVREAITHAIICKNCYARISLRSISFDHIKRVEDGGVGTPDNAQMMHPYCNTGEKERKVAEAKRLKK